MRKTYTIILDIVTPLSSLDIKLQEATTPELSCLESSLKKENEGINDTLIKVKEPVITLASKEVERELKVTPLSSQGDMGPQLVLSNYPLFGSWRKHLGDIHFGVNPLTLDEAFAFAKEYNLDFSHLMGRLPVAPVSNWNFYAAKPLAKVISSVIHIMVDEESGRVMKVKYVYSRYGSITDNTLKDNVKYRYAAAYARSPLVMPKHFKN